MIRQLILLLAIGISHAQWNHNRTECKAWVKRHNAAGNSTWRAKLAPSINYEDESEMQHLIGARLSPNFNSVLVADYKPRARLLQNLPTSYDLRNVYPKCASLTFVRNQYSCGGCWAFATMNSLSDRTCIKTYGQATPMQRGWSFQDMLECCDEATCGVAPTQGCNGGYLDGAYLYALRTGVVTGEQANDSKNCKPYFINSFVGLLPAPTCRSYCTNPLFTKSYATDRMRIRGVKAYSSQTMAMEDFILAVKDALIRRGTLSAFLEIHEDFYAYSSGVYQVSFPNLLGYHAVRVIGWGVENGVRYWLCVNSWGEYWGDRGNFKILMGQNTAGIERYMIEGVL
jgi:cathepsin B